MWDSWSQVSRCPPNRVNSKKPNGFGRRPGSAVAKMRRIRPALEPLPALSSRPHTPLEVAYEQYRSNVRATGSRRPRLTTTTGWSAPFSAGPGRSASGPSRSWTWRASASTAGSSPSAPPAAAAGIPLGRTESAAHLLPLGAQGRLPDRSSAPGPAAAPAGLEGADPLSLPATGTAPGRLQSLPCLREAGGTNPGRLRGAQLRTLLTQPIGS